MVFPGGNSPYTASGAWLAYMGRVAEQGMVFGLSTLNRVYNYLRVPPK